MTMKDWLKNSDNWYWFMLALLFGWIVFCIVWALR